MQGQVLAATGSKQAPKVYDPIANTLTILAADSGKGQVPTGCPIIWRFLDRVFLAGAAIAPHVWYCAREGTSTDWDYAALDNERAVAGTASAAGVPGDPIVCAFAHSDDYSIIGCRNSIWRMLGDPVSGGSLNAVSRTVGIIGPDAWCLGPDGSLIFLSLDGIYSLDAGAELYPTSLSRELMPMELVNIDPNQATVSLQYDVSDRGIQIYTTRKVPIQKNIGGWIGWDGKNPSRRYSHSFYPKPSGQLS